MPLFFNQEVTCLVNPRVGREYENSMDIVEKAKKVMIVGGGPAGLQAAETAAMKLFMRLRKKLAVNLDLQLIQLVKEN